MTRGSGYGIALAAFGVLVLTPDTLFMRLSGMEGWPMVAWRGLLGGPLLLAVWLLAEGRRIGAAARPLVTGAGLAAILSQGTNAGLFSLGIAAAPVAVVLFGVATSPIFAALFSRLLMGERTHPATWVAIVLVLAGIGLAVFGGADGLRLDLGTLFGAACGLGVAAALALSFVLIRAHAALPVLGVVGCGSTLSGLFGLALAGPAAMTDGAVWAIAVTGLVILPLSFWALGAAPRYTPAANVSLLLLLETVLGPLWVWLGTGEAPTRAMLAGGAIVIATLAIYLWHGARRTG
jgi:drug/metabolite transporter (DMT)-like permease